MWGFKGTESWEHFFFFSPNSGTFWGEGCLTLHLEPSLLVHTQLLCTLCVDCLRACIHNSAVLVSTQATEASSGRVGLFCATSRQSSLKDAHESGGICKTLSGLW